MKLMPRTKYRKVMQARNKVSTNSNENIKVAYLTSKQIERAYIAYQNAIKTNKQNSDIKNLTKRIRKESQI